MGVVSGRRPPSPLVPFAAAASLACASLTPPAPQLSPAVARTEALPPLAIVPVTAPAPLADPSVNIAWAYRAGAPLAAPPAIAADGALVVGSVDGYLHALRRDGSFRWGYTLRGPLVGRPAFAPNGDVFAAADPNGLYALDADGNLLWVSSVAGGVRSPPVVDRLRRVWVTTGQGTLLGFSGHGGVVGFAHVGNGRTLGPAPLANGGVAIASADGDVRVAGHAGAVRASAAAPLFDLEAAGDALFVLGADGLSRFDWPAGEERWSRLDVARVACSSPALVVVDHHGLRWLSPRGEPESAVAVSVGSQRPIACLPDGSLLVPDDAGRLVRLDASGIKARARLPAGRLVSLDPTVGGLVVAGYRDGRVLALEPPH
jgi:PQQ-like domain